ncbi:hypothetical protein BH11PSE12_BH11PSE12_34500 [soil metagenome]
MLNQITKVSFNFTQEKTALLQAIHAFLRTIVSGIMTTMHHAVMIVGVAAITLMSLLYVKPEISRDIKMKAFSPFKSSAEDSKIGSDQLSNLLNATAKPISVSASLNASQQQQLVSDWLSKRYRVAGNATDMLVSSAYATANDTKLDPLLILAVMAIESGLNPFAESPVGAQGLMQVMSKLHYEKFESLGGVKAALNPAANIKVGALILKDYVTRGGSVEAGLKLYVGAAAFDTDFGYGSKVLLEYHRLKEIAQGRKVPIFTASASKILPKPTEIESLNEDEKSLLPLDKKSVSSNNHLSTPNKINLVAEL